MSNTRLSITLATVTVISMMLAGSAKGQSGDYAGFQWNSTDGVTAAIIGYDGPGGNVAIPALVTDINGNSYAVTSIGGWGYTSLTGVTIPDSVTYIGHGAFSECSSLSSVTTGNGVTVIDAYAFQSCSSLATLTLGNNVTSIGEGAFEHCSSLTSLTIPDSVASLADDSFWDCGNLASVSIGNGVTSIGDSAFYKCYKLTNVTIGNRVNSIAGGAFAACGLTSVTIPASVTSILGWPFAACTNLPAIAVDALNPAYCSAAGVLFNKNRFLDVSSGQKPDAITSHIATTCTF